MTDHVWFNIPQNLQHGLIEIYVLKLIKEQPCTASDLIQRIASTMNIWLSPTEMLSCLKYMQKRHRITNNGDIFNITDNGKEKIDAGAWEIAKFIHTIDPSYSIFYSCKKPNSNKFGMDNCCSKCSKPIIDHPLTLENHQ